MPRTARIVMPGIAHHITQRGNHKQMVFFDDADRRKYLSLLKENGETHGMRVLAYCLMSNHIHIVGIPAREDALWRVVGNTHFRYTTYVNKKYGTHGHLWQNRYYSCPMDEAHTLNAIAYVELNPVRAGMLDKPWLYPWSSCRAHCDDSGIDELLHLARWRSQFSADYWKEHVGIMAEDKAFVVKIRACTQSGRALGDNAFQKRVADALTK